MTTPNGSPLHESTPLAEGARRLSGTLARSYVTTHAADPI